MGRTINLLVNDVKRGLGFSPSPHSLGMCHKSLLPLLAIARLLPANLPDRGTPKLDLVRFNIATSLTKYIFLTILLVSAFFTIYADKKGKPKNTKLVVGGQQGVMFDQYDANKDGKISKEEFLKVFAEMDLDKDGFVDLYETNEYSKKIKAKLDKEFDK
jgi:hypothetical protein